jgi:hypothetical protein
MNGIEKKLVAEEMVASKSEESAERISRDHTGEKAGAF